MGEHILARNFQQFIGGGSCLWFLPMLFPSGIGTSIVDPSPGMYLQAQGGRGTREWTLSLIGSHFPGVPLDAAVYSNQAFGQPKAPWRCLFPNRLYLDPLAGSGNFVGMPPYFDIEPFWP
jgi:hypothetical protein